MNHNLQIKKIVKNSLGPELSGHWKNRSVPSDFINNFHATVIILQEHQHLLFERKKKVCILRNYIRKIARYLETCGQYICQLCDQDQPLYISITIYVMLPIFVGFHLNVW